MLLSHLKETRETPEIPLWASIIMNGLAKPAATRPIFYLSHDVWQIVEVGTRQDPTGEFFIIVKCEGLGANASETHVKTVWPTEFDHLTLKKYKHGHALVYKDLLDEGVDEPLFASMAKKLVDAKKPVYFASGGYQITTMLGPAGSTRFPKQSYVLWLEHTTKKEHGQPKKSTYTIWEEGFDNWVLERFKDGHRLVMRKKEAVNEDIGEPLIVTLMNRRLNQLGAIKVDVTHNGYPLRGWVTEPFTESDSIGTKIYTAKVTGRPKGLSAKKYLAIMGHEVSSLYTLKSSKDGNGNTVVTLVDR